MTVTEKSHITLHNHDHREEGTMSLITFVLNPFLDLIPRRKEQ